MTLHTKAATEDILDIFNQPLRNVDPMAGPAESAGESDYDDDDYTSAGESTGTGRISGTSEFGDTDADIQTVADVEDTNAAAPSVSPWSDFTASKHVPKLDVDEEDENDSQETDEPGFVILPDFNQIGDHEKDEDIDIITPISPQQENDHFRPRYVPIPPEDYEAPTPPFKDPSQVSQNRLPFMTPIVEKTESSMGALTIREDKDYFNSKTPSRHKSNGHATPQIDEELVSSPLQEIVNEASPPRKPKMNIAKSKPSAREASGAIIKDAQCNPVDDSIRKSILEAVQPSFLYSDYHDYRPRNFNRTPELRKFIKALSKPKSASDKTTTSLSLPPVLRFPQVLSKSYTIKRELGKGAFAPVYLAAEEDANSDEAEQLLAIKCEHPPTSWEFHIMALLHLRLDSRPATSSLLKPHSLHLFADEGYLLESYLDQGTLLDLVNLAKNDPSSANTTGTLDESIAMFFTIELLKTVEAMHSIGILHGDLKADNCLVRLFPSGVWDTQYCPEGSNGWSSKGLCLIDFGRGIDMRAFRPDVAFVADWKTGKQDCVEMRELRPWTYQVDYFGIAGVIHSLLFGKYIEDVAVDAAMPKDFGDGDRTIGIGIASKKKWKLREGLKRYWQSELWAPLFEILLNPTSNVEGEEGGKMPCVKGLRACRESMERWLQGDGGRRNGGLRNSLMRLEDRIRERKGR